MQEVEDNDLDSDCVSKSIQYTKNHLVYYYNEVKRGSLDLSKDQQEVLLRELRASTDKKRNTEIVDILCRANVKLVYKIAKTYSYSEDSLINYISAGNEGLLNAIEKFQPGKAPFPNYAPFWIKQKILHEIYTNTPIKVPLWRVKSFIKIKLFIVEYKNSHSGKKPTNSVISRATEIPLKNVTELRNDEYLTKILDRSTDDEEFPIQSIFDELITKQPKLQVNTECITDTCDLPYLINSALAYLSNEQKFVIQAYYGLLDGNRKKLHEVAKVIDRTPERVRQIRNEAVSILHNILTKAGINMDSVFTTR